MSFALLLKASFAASCSASFLLPATPTPNTTSSSFTTILNVLLCAGPVSSIASYVAPSLSV